MKYGEEHSAELLSFQLKISCFTILHNMTLGFEVFFILFAKVITNLKAVLRDKHFSSNICVGFETIPIQGRGHEAPKNMLWCLEKF